MTLNLPDWTTAACKDYDTNLFFPASREEWYDTRDQLRAICNGCPLFNPCLEYALQIKVSGVWAGTDYAERRALRRVRGITASTVLASKTI